MAGTSNNGGNDAPIFGHVKKLEIRLPGKKLAAKIISLGIMPMAAHRPLNTLASCASRCRSMND